MKRIVIDIKGNLAFCGIDKGNYTIDNIEGKFVETDSNIGLRIWCPICNIMKTHIINIPDDC